MKYLLPFCIGNITYNFLDDGLANILGLETLRHGTNPISNISLRIFGAQPYFGGTGMGSTKDFADCDTRDFFFLFKESEFPEDLYNYSHLDLTRPKEVKYRILPKLHSILAGYNLLSYPLKQKCFKDILVLKKVNLVIGVIGGIASCFFSPTLRFRFNKIDHTKFINDHDYGYKAYKTNEPVLPWRLGPMGSILTGVNFNWYSRAKTHPKKIITGVFQITTGVALGILFSNNLLKNPCSSIAGALLA